MITERPRLLIGKSSVTPWRRAKKIICQIFKFITYFTLSLLKIFLYVHLKFCFCLCIDIRPILLGEEEIVACPGRCSRCLHAGKPRATNRSRRKPCMRIGIPETAGSNVAASILKRFPIACCSWLRVAGILYRWIGIKQPYSFSIWHFYTIPIDTGYKWPILVKYCLTLDNRGKDHHLVHP